jgi:tetratricopeptide (TPR) repeat protein
MIRWAIAALLAAVPLAAAQSAPQAPAPKQVELKTERPPARRNDAIEAPPEEDKSVAPDTYDFNPLESEKAVRIGNYYFKLHNYRPALNRYKEATQWNPGNGDAWLHVAEAAEKTKDTAIAKDAYAQYLKLEPDAKNAAEIRKKMEKLK